LDAYIAQVKAEVDAVAEARAEKEVFFGATATAAGLSKVEMDAYVSKVKAEVDAIAKTRTEKENFFGANADAAAGLSKVEVDAYVEQVKAEVDAIAKARAEKETFFDALAPASEQPESIAAAKDEEELSGAEEQKPTTQSSPSDLTVKEAKGLKVGKLRAELESRSLPTDGLKAVLQQRLVDAIMAPKGETEEKAPPKPKAKAKAKGFGKTKAQAKVKAKSKGKAGSTDTKAARPPPTQLKPVYEPFGGAYAGAWPSPPPPVSEGEQSEPFAVAKDEDAEEQSGAKSAKSGQLKQVYEPTFGFYAGLPPPASEEPESSTVAKDAEEGAGGPSVEEQLLEHMRAEHSGLPDLRELEQEVSRILEFEFEAETQAAEEDQHEAHDASMDASADR
jgi:hypothetical protein